MSTAKEGAKNQNERDEILSAAEAHGWSTALGLATGVQYLSKGGRTVSVHFDSHGRLTSDLGRRARLLAELAR